MDLIELWTICSANGIILNEIQRKQIERYTKELQTWNSKVNLISRKDEQNILEKHILHSLSILKYIDLDNNYECIDIGTGGGLPGIPLAIASQKINMTLVDSIKKKAKVTSILADHTQTNRITTIRDRVEVIANKKEYKKKFDFLFARGVATLNKIVNWSMPILKKDAKIVLLKGGDLLDEINEAKANNKALKVKEFELDLIAYDKFKNEGKKILIVTFNNK